MLRPQRPVVDADVVNQAGEEGLGSHVVTTAKPDVESPQCQHFAHACHGIGKTISSIQTVSCPIDAHLVRYHLNVNSIKDRLFRLLFETAEPGPGYFHLPRDTSAEIKAHLTSEEQRIFYKGFAKQAVWQPKKGGGPNHLWDCGVYATAAAELAGVGRLEAPVFKPTRKSQEQRQGHTAGRFLHELPRLNQ